MRSSFFVLALMMVGCAVDAGDESTASDEEAIAYGNPGFVQLYNANSKHLSEPGRPSFEGTDYTQLLSFMRTQDVLPDVITLQEVGTKTGRFTSQSCTSVIADLDRLVRPSAAKTTWKCIVAAGSPSALDNTPGGVAIIHRARFEPAEDKRLVGLYKWTTNGCVREKGGSGWTALVQKFHDGKHTIAFASVHLPVASATNGNGATADDCSGRNLALIDDALAATKADVKVIAGDMNHGDATRHLAKDGTVVHDWWETTYRTTREKYRDPFYDECAKRNAAEAAVSRCLESDDWTMDNAGSLNTRIDWVMVDGAKSLEGARTIAYKDVDAAVNYSDHRAEMLRIRY